MRSGRRRNEAIDTNKRGKDKGGEGVAEGRRLRAPRKMLRWGKRGRKWKQGGKGRGVG